MESTFYAVFLGFLGGIVGGGCFYLVVHWGHIRFQLGLEYRLSDLEGRVSREVKIRAAETHSKKKSIEETLLEKISNEAPEPELNMKSWIKDGFKRV